MRIKLPALCALTTALLMGACDDSESSDPGTFSSGIEPSKTVDGLTDAEAKLFCDESERSFAALVSPRKQCELFSVFFTEDAATCRALTDECVQAPPEPEGESEESECTFEDAEKRMACPVSVEVLEGCIGALRGLTATTLGKIGCGDAGNTEGLEAKFANLPMGIDEVPGCETVAAECPELFDDDDDFAMGMSSMQPPVEE